MYMKRNSSVITKDQLVELYLRKKMSVSQIAKKFSCSETKINYWLKNFAIQKRTISESLYSSLNPEGDPFLFKAPKTLEESFLFGLGVGLYWGEGNKKNQYSVRLGNTDPYLVKYFLLFLKNLYCIREDKLRFGLQIFSDTSPKEALRFWASFLNVSTNRFGKVIMTPSRGVGTYKEKNKYGVLTVYFSNKKLRDELLGEIEKLRSMD